jgi:hypothetical protein
MSCPCGTAACEQSPPRHGRTACATSNAPGRLPRRRSGRCVIPSRPPDHPAWKATTLTASCDGDDSWPTRSRARALSSRCNSNQAPTGSERRTRNRAVPAARFALHVIEVAIAPRARSPRSGGSERFGGASWRGLPVPERRTELPLWNGGARAVAAAPRTMACATSSAPGAPSGSAAQGAIATMRRRGVNTHEESGGSSSSIRTPCPRSCYCTPSSPPALRGADRRTSRWSR